MIRIKKTSDKSITPTKGSVFAAGYDLYSIDNSVTLFSLERKLFKTGIHIQIPVGWYGRIAPRSGLAYKQGIDVMAGVIDSDYTGEIGVILINLGSEPQEIDTTKPIAQIIIEKYSDHDFVQVENLETTERGAGGYGSTDGKLVANPIVFDEKPSDMAERYRKGNYVEPIKTYEQKMKEAKLL